MSAEAEALHRAVAQAMSDEIARQAADPRIGAVFDGDLVALAKAALEARKRFFAVKSMLKGGKQ